MLSIRNRFFGPILIILVLCARSEAATDATEKTLRALQFVDVLEGWAVGDDGVILHSVDGGIHWEHQKSGTTASLRSLHFIDPTTGWAVGSLEKPTRSIGVLLFTQDSGRTWKIQSHDNLPGLNFIRFWADGTGVAAGQNTLWCPSGLHATRDNGKTWISLPGSGSSPVIAADFKDAKNGILLRADGQIDSLREGQLLPAEYDPLKGKRAQAVKLIDRQAFAVGEGDLILRSSDSGGLRWGYLTNPTLKKASPDVDWRSLAQSGNHLWVAGSPGSIVLHSPDLGKNWEVQRLQLSTPLRALHFFDENFGWAVGEFGCIHKTVDGGKTWKAMTPRKRPAVLIHSESDEGIRYELVTQFAKVEGYRTAILRKTTAQKASCEWEAWNYAGGHGWENRTTPLTEREAVLALRTWQPDVTIQQDASESLNPADGIWKDAYEKAFDPTAYPEQLDLLNLKPWAPWRHFHRETGSKVFALDPRCQEFSERLQGSAWEYVEEAYSAANQQRPLEGSCKLQMQWSRGENPAPRDLLDGLPYHAETRMNLENLVTSEKTVLSKQLFRERQIIQTVASQTNSFANPDSLVVQVKPLLSKMPAGLAARSCFNLGHQMASQGQWPQAKEIFQIVLRDYPEDPLALEALRWMIQYHSSSECRRRVEIQNHMIQEQIKAETLVASQDTNRFVQQRDVSLIRRAEDNRNWHMPALELMKKFPTLNSSTQTDPSLEICLAAAQRNLGEIDQATKYMQKLVSELPKGRSELRALKGVDPWKDILLSELWLMNRADGLGNPKLVGVARRAAARPKLDGIFDDECWKDVVPLKLKPVQAQGISSGCATLRVRFDSDFLYLAMECPHDEGKPIPKLSRRTRDMNLQGQDRVALFFDLDRDYQTFFRFEFDARGAVRDDCWGDSTWNPKWFVAMNSDESHWRAEIAIPLVELTNDSSLPGKIWAFNVIRTKKSGEKEAWSLRNGKEPELVDLGLLQFLEQPQPK